MRPLLFCWLYRVALFAAEPRGLHLFAPWESSGLVARGAVRLFGCSYTPDRYRTAGSLLSAVRAKIWYVHHLCTRELATEAQCYPIYDPHSCRIADLSALSLDYLWESI